MLKGTDGLGNEIDKIAVSINRIKEFASIAESYNPDGYYVCISGGKDSSVIQQLVIESGVKAHFFNNHTSVDAPPTVYFIREEKERIEKLGYQFTIQTNKKTDGTSYTMWNSIPYNGTPTRYQRWCCKYLKEYGGQGWYVITGVRWAESINRRSRAVNEIQGKTKSEGIYLNNDNDMKRRLNEMCLQKQRLVLNPIIDWSDSDVWEYIKLRKLPVNPLYKPPYNFKRVGCVGCPLGNSAKRDFALFPKYYQAYIRAFNKLIERRRERGLPPLDSWMDADGKQTGQAVMDWWLNKGYTKVAPDFNDY
jgi:phosphoadenosine phosphosulfate reductase